jgi:hypothetical protein
MLASRLTLFGLFVFGALFLLMVPELIEDLREKPLKHKNGFLSASIIALFVGMILLDYWAPKPLTLANLPKGYTTEILDGIESATVSPPIAVGTEVAGVPWQKSSILTEIKLSTHDYVSNVELHFYFDTFYVGASQVTHVPGVIIEPEQRPSSNVTIKGTGKDGKPFVYVPSPDEDQLLSTYPAQVFIFRSPSLSKDLPVMLNFVTGTNKTQNWTLEARASIDGIKNMTITGHYDIQYREKAFTIPVNFRLERKRQ